MGFKVESNALKIIEVDKSIVYEQDEFINLAWNDRRFKGFDNNVLKVELPKFPVNEDDILTLYLSDEDNVFLLLDVNIQSKWDIHVTKTHEDVDIRKHMFVCELVDWATELVSKMGEATGNTGIIEVNFKIKNHEVKYFGDSPNEEKDLEDDDKELETYEEVVD